MEPAAQRIGVERGLQAAMGAYVVRLLAYLVSWPMPGCRTRVAAGWHQHCCMSACACSQPVRPLQHQRP